MKKETTKEVIAEILIEKVVEVKKSRSRTPPKAIEPVQLKPKTRDRSSSSER